MRNIVISLVMMLTFSFGLNKQEAQQDKYYKAMDSSNELLLTAAPKKEKEQKSPLRKRAHKRKRKIRYPSRGK